jgi:hypothetical protein
VAFTKDPALAIWQAMQPLAAIHLRTDTPAIAKILAEAETILFGLILALVRRPEPVESAPKRSQEPDGQDRHGPHDEPWHHQPIDDR